MRYIDLVNAIKDVSLKHYLVNEFAEGDIYEWLNSKQHKYPCVVLTTNNISTGEDVNTLNANLFYVDRLTDNDDNKLKIQSLGVTVLQQIINKLDLSWDSTIYTPFTEKFADLCAGVYVTFNIEYEAESLCDDGDFEVKALTITKNGIYDVVGYDQVSVNIPAKETEQTLTAKLSFNGLEIGNNVIEAPKDVFYNKVTVNAPDKVDFNLGVYGMGGSPRIDFNEFNFVSSPIYNMNYKFAGCEYVDIIDLSNVELQTRSDWVSCFENCTTLDFIYFPNQQTILNDCSRMFYNCGTIDDNTWVRFANMLKKNTDESYKTQVSEMFARCKFIRNPERALFLFNKLISCCTISNFTGMFKNALIGSVFKPDIDIVIPSGNIGYFSSMFEHNISRTLKEVDMTIVPRNVVNFVDTFNYCSGLTKVTLRFKKYEGDTADMLITEWDRMFKSCGRLEEINILGPIKMDSFRSSSAFYFCKKLKTINVENADLVSTLQQALKNSLIPDGQVTINVINQ
jgi:hypothetical protein